MHILAIIGSLRKASFNRMAYEAARTLLPAGVTMDTADIADIPLYNGDAQEATGIPPSASRLAGQIAKADGVLFISPEYNYSIPGVLKNAIDWVSRVPDQPFKAKPVAMMGASMGALGTARMQYHLRQVLVFVDARAMARPEVMIGQAQNRFDPQGRLTDDKTRKSIAGLLEAFAAWIRLLQAGTPRA